MTQKHKHLIVRADIGWCPKEEDLNRISDWIRSLIKKIDMKFLPKVYFVADKSFDYAEKIEKLIQKNK